MDFLDVIRVLHVLGACVLVGTGAGIAFFMVMANRTQDPKFIADTASVVVVADTVFTATAAILQPISGLILVWGLGWALSEIWILISLFLYVFIGVFWIPVIFIQMRMRDEAQRCYDNTIPLSERYKRLYRIWFAFGFPAFGAIIFLLYLMILTPSF